jgi:small subunit ribosomal protein S1
VVVSRRAVLEASQGAGARRCSLTCREGAPIRGIVKNITDCGAFVDLGGIDRLLRHDLAWRRVSIPPRCSVGDGSPEGAQVRHRKIRVSLGMEAARRTGSACRAAPAERLFGKVTNLRLRPLLGRAGHRGLVHVSEMDWTNRTCTRPVVALGDGSRS